MDMAEEVFLILHGWGGNKPAHWQEHLVLKLQEAGKTVRYPKMPEPTAPDLHAWQSTLSAEIEAIRLDHPNALLTVLAHSLGSINWLHYTASRSFTSPIAERVLLVAPPYVVPQLPPIDVPPGVTGFFPPPIAPASVRAASNATDMIASDTDDYATYDQSSGYAQKFEIPIHILKGAGHISPYYGYGEWPWVLEWCLRSADLPPQPKPAE
jgi:predicted alpha/beta hydrolase family esterase